MTVPSVRVLVSPPWRTRQRNPYAALLYSALEELGVAVDDGPPGRRVHDVWHVHWPESVLQRRPMTSAAAGAAGLLARLRAARRAGTRIIWTVHNLAPHERGEDPVTRAFLSLFTRHVDGVISLSGAGLAAARGRYPRLRTVPGAVIAHGHYRDAYPPAVPRPQARARLGVEQDAYLYAFVGRIRRYKQAPRLASAFRSLADADARLLIAGRPHDRHLEAELRRAEAGDPRVLLRLGFLDAGEIATVLGAADLVVLPSSTFLHSGSALLALSFDRPLLAPDTEAIHELRAQIGSAWIRTYRRELSAPGLAAARTPGPEGRAPLEHLAWPGLAAATLAFYETVLGTARAPVPS